MLSVILFVVFSPKAEGISNNPCSPCHPFPNGAFDQYLDILEFDTQTQIPSSINKDENIIVSVAIENTGNPGIYQTISGVSLRLTSQHGFFSVDSETYSIGNMQLGKQKAIWQITGQLDGYDTILISAIGINQHGPSQFAESYSIPITVGIPSSTPTSTPAPTPSPTPTFSPTPIPTTTPSPTSSPSRTATPTPTPTPNPSQLPSPSPTLSPSNTPLPRPTEEQPLVIYAIIATILITIAGLTVFMILHKK